MICNIFDMLFIKSQIIFILGLQMSDMIAHARQDSSKNWHSHPLQKHLQKVAQLAKRFAGRYGALFAEYAGLLHDLGKFQEAFQKYIRKQPPSGGCVLKPFGVCIVQIVILQPPSCGCVSIYYNPLALPQQNR